MTSARNSTTFVCGSFALKGNWKRTSSRCSLGCFLIFINSHFVVSVLIWSTAYIVNSQYVNSGDWRVDIVGIDQVGIDQVEIDQVRRVTNFII